MPKRDTEDAHGILEELGGLENRLNLVNSETFEKLHRERRRSWTETHTWHPTALARYRDGSSIVVTRNTIEGSHIHLGINSTWINRDREMLIDHISRAHPEMPREWIEQWLTLASPYSYWSERDAALLTRRKES